MSQQAKMVVYVDPAVVPTLKPVHEIHLSTTAQMYSIIVGKNILTICENAGIMSFYSCTYGSLLDEENSKTKSEKSTGKSADKPGERSGDKTKSEETKAESDSGKSKQ